MPDALKSGSDGSLELERVYRIEGYSLSGINVTLKVVTLSENLDSIYLALPAILPDDLQGCSEEPIEIPCKCFVLRNGLLDRLLG